MKFEDLNENINIENGTIEFKGIIKEGKDEKGEPQELDWLKTIVGFANTYGGTLYIGVDNYNHNLLSFDYPTVDSLTLMINNQIRNRIEPFIDYEIKEININNTNRYILKVMVKKSSFLPVVLHVSSMSLIYVRYFGQTRQANPDEIRELVLSSEHASYDSYLTNENWRR